MLDANELRERALKIKAFAYDIDGVFTDGSLLALPDGDLLRVFNAKDGMGARVAYLNGFKQAIITGGVSKSVIHRCNTLGIPTEDIYMGSRNKLPDFFKFCEKYGFQPEEVCYVGDDLPDISILKSCGFAACPADAIEEVKEVCHYVSPNNGGRGCIRNIVEFVLKNQGKFIFDSEDYDGIKGGYGLAKDHPWK